ncbi:hypothetical protein R3P38DRAFT_1499300 [Favolaschia claudopus]|uniref:Uncharacterized protein n=1 Tax=Favolaschia claudopus TaxID=2862362 RepID=A0AAW0AKD4_9AGAR
MVLNELSDEVTSTTRPADRGLPSMLQRKLPKSLTTYTQPVAPGEAIWRTTYPQMTRPLVHGPESELDTNHQTWKKFKLHVKSRVCKSMRLSDHCRAGDFVCSPFLHAKRRPHFPTTLILRDWPCRTDPRRVAGVKRRRSGCCSDCPFVRRFILSRYHCSKWITKNVNDVRFMQGYVAVSPVAHGGAGRTLSFTGFTELGESFG